MEKGFMNIISVDELTRKNNEGDFEVGEVNFVVDEKLLTDRLRKLLSKNN